jgi:hypothetical protein
MKYHLSISLSLFLCFSTVFLSGCPVGGGTCEYKNYAGTATIKKVIKFPSEKPENSSGDKNNEKLFIEFEFTADPGESVPAQVRSISGQEQITQELSEKKEASVGKTYRTSAGYISKGTCHPGPTFEKFENWK